MVSLGGMPIRGKPWYSEFGKGGESHGDGSARRTLLPSPLHESSFLSPLQSLSSLPLPPLQLSPLPSFFLNSSQYAFISRPQKPRFLSQSSGAATLAGVVAGSSALPGAARSAGGAIFSGSAKKATLPTGASLKSV